nr:hypothetical protein [Tanacetum cinerariifolium]
MLLAKKDKDEQVLLAEDQAWMESSSDSDQEINANIVFMAQIENVLSDFEASSSSADQKIFEIDRLARSLLIQGLLNDIYSLIDINKTAKDLSDALARHMLGSEYGEQDRKAVILYEYETFKATEGELLLDTYIQ